MATTRRLRSSTNNATTDDGSPRANAADTVGPGRCLTMGLRPCVAAGAQGRSTMLIELQVLFMRISFATIGDAAPPIPEVLRLSDPEPDANVRRV